MDALQAIEQRKSTRSYSPKAVEQEKIETLLQAGSRAPKVGRFHISVITNNAVLAQINEKALSAMQKGSDFMKKRAALKGYQPLYGAPLLLLIATPDVPYSDASAACVATNITIAATALGLGSCFVATPILALQSDEALQKSVGVPEGYLPRYGVLIGYKKDEAFSTDKKIAVSVNYCE